MRYLLSFAIAILSLNLNAQLEKIGAYSNTSFVIQKYRSYNNAGMNSPAFIAVRHRIGGMASFYLDSRFSYEVGLLAEQHQKPNNKNRSFLYDDGFSFNLTSHKYVNIGIPLSVTMRTNNARNCATYFKLSLVNLFTVYDHQSGVTKGIPDELEIVPSYVSGSKTGINYFSTDIDFGFGTFWYLKKFGAKLCLEPKITIAQYRGRVKSNQFPNRDIFIPEFNILTSMGFEITIYKDMF